MALLVPVFQILRSSGRMPYLSPARIGLHAPATCGPQPPRARAVERMGQVLKTFEV